MIMVMLRIENVYQLLIFCGRYIHLCLTTGAGDPIGGVSFKTDKPCANTNDDLEFPRTIPMPLFPLKIVMSNTMEDPKLCLLLLR